MRRPDPLSSAVLPSVVFLYIQGESFARGPKLFSIKNDVIEIMT